MIVRPYGDTPDDGAVQLSFTLPVPPGDTAHEAARALARAMGLEDIHVAHAAPLSAGFTFFVVYGRTTHSVDLARLRAPRAHDEVWPFEKTNAYIHENVGRPIVVVGACIGDDAHTVGIDAILDMKGCQGREGLERYPGFRVHNLGAQVKPESLIARARAVGADALLVSKLVTQQGIHVHDVTRLVDMLEAERLRDRFVIVLGGPRITHRLAKELGCDAGFGRGTTPDQVATYLAREVHRRQKEGKIAR